MSQSTPSRQQLTGVVQEAKRAWRSGQTPDVAGVIREHPDVLFHRTFVVDLAYEAYCLRESAGQTPETDAFLNEIPAFRTQIREVILGHRELADHFPTIDSEPAAWPSEGDRLESLTILGELGRGSFARVYLAQDANMGNRHVVLKLSAVPSYEGHTLGNIQQPNIVSVLWARKLGGLFAICMPYVGSTTLGDILEAVATDGKVGPYRAGMILKTIEKTSVIPDDNSAETLQLLFPASESYVRAIARIGVQLAEALAYLHSKGIVHGDIKPSNILLDRSAQPYLIDFNMARREDDWLLRFGGTLPYMAPEALDPSLPEHSLFAAEVYSLGLVLYHTLAGRLPHEPTGTELRDVARDQLARKSTGCPPIRSLNRKVPRRMARAIDACLSVEPGKRPIASQLAQELKSVATPSRWPRVLVLLLSMLLLGAVAQRLNPSDKEPGNVPSRDPVTHEEYFARGLAFLEADKVTLAMMDFDVARGMNPDGKTLAHIGYCLSRSGRHRDAASAYKEAIGRDYAPAWVHNNRANALIQSGQNVLSLMKTALESAQKAREIGPCTREMTLNWAFAKFIVAMEGRPRSFNDRECTQELKDALIAGPIDVDLCIQAAWVLSASGSEHHDEAISLLRKAVNLGKDPKALTRDAFLRKHLANHKDYQPLDKLSPGSKPLEPLHLRLMSPVP